MLANVFGGYGNKDGKMSSDWMHCQLSGAAAPAAARPRPSRRDAHGRRLLTSTMACSPSSTAMAERMTRRQGAGVKDESS